MLSALLSGLLWAPLLTRLTLLLSARLSAAALAPLSSSASSLLLWFPSALLSAVDCGGCRQAKLLSALLLALQSTAENSTAVTSVSIPVGSAGVGSDVGCGKCRGGKAAKLASSSSLLMPILGFGGTKTDHVSGSEKGDLFILLLARFVDARPSGRWLGWCCL